MAASLGVDDTRVLRQDYSLTVKKYLDVSNIATPLVFSNGAAMQSQLLINPYSQGLSEINRLANVTQTVRLWLTGSIKPVPPPAQGGSVRGYGEMVRVIVVHDKQQETGGGTPVLGEVLSDMQAIGPSSYYNMDHRNRWNIIVDNSLVIDPYFMATGVNITATAPAQGCAGTCKLLEKDLDVTSRNLLTYFNNTVNPNPVSTSINQGGLWLFLVSETNGLIEFTGSVRTEFVDQITM